MFDLELEWDRPARSGPRPTEHILRVRLLPVAATTRPSGLPLRLAIALDTSSSMEGEKLASAIEACRAVIARLRPEDRFSLAGFGGEVRPLLQSVAGDLAACASAGSVLSSLTAFGVTRADLALDWLQQALPQENDVVRVGMLITDGHPTDERGRLLEETAPLIAQAARLGQSGITLCTVGLGNAANFNTAFLVDLSDRGRGAFLYADTPQALEPQLNTRLTTAQSMALTGARLEFRPLLPGVVLKECCRFRPEFLPMEAQFGSELWSLQPGALSADAPTDLLLTLQVPPSEFGDPSGSRDILEVRLEGAETGASVAQVASLVYTASYAEAQRLDAGVDNDRLQWEINVYSQALNRTTDPRRTAELLSNIAFVAQKAGKEGIADLARTQLIDLKRTGKLDAHRATGLLTSTRSLGGKP